VNISAKVTNEQVSADLQMPIFMHFSSKISSSFNYFLYPADYKYHADFLINVQDAILYTRLRSMNEASCQETCSKNVQNYVIMVFCQAKPCSMLDTYKGESVNRLQMDIKRKICSIRTWEKH
jgi:hypothetical protein